MDRKGHFTKIGFILSLFTGFILYGQISQWWRFDSNVVLVMALLLVVGFIIMVQGIKMAIKKRGG